MTQQHARIPGEFVPLDVNYAHDRAIRQAGPHAELLFVRGVAYARKYKTDGLIPDYDLSVAGVGIPNVTRHAATLVRVGLWLAADDGWLIRSFPKWNPVSEAERAGKQSKGGSLGNHNRWHTNGRRSDDCTFCAPIGKRLGSDRSTDSLRIAEREGEREKRESDTSRHESSPSVTRETGDV